MLTFKEAEWVLVHPGWTRRGRRNWNLSPKQSHQQVLAVWLFAQAMFGKAALLYRVFPSTQGFQGFTYITIYTGMSERKQATTSCGTFKNRVTTKILPPWLTSEGRFTPSVHWEQGREPGLSCRNVRALGVSRHFY